MLASIMKLLVYAALGVLVLVGGFFLTLVLWTPAERRADPDPRPAYDVSSQPRALPSFGRASTVNPDWPGARFPSDAWRGSDLEWYVQWKRVHKYARIAYQTAQPAGFAPLRDQARDLWEAVAGWNDGRPRAACLPAAEQLHKAVSALVEEGAGGLSLLRASESAGDKCRAAAQAATRGR